MDSTGRLPVPIVGGFIAAAWGPRAPFLIFAAMALIALIPTSSFAKDTPRQGDGKRNKKAVRTISLRDVIMPRLVYFGVALFAGLTRGPLNADLLHLYAAFAYDLGPAADRLSRHRGLVPVVADRLHRRLDHGPLRPQADNGARLHRRHHRDGAPRRLGLRASIAAWYVGLFLLGVATQALTGGSVQTVGADVAPAEARGTFLGIWRFTGQGGVALGPIIFALVADTVDYGTAFLFTSGCAAVVAFLLIRYVPETAQAIGD